MMKIFTQALSFSPSTLREKKEQLKLMFMNHDGSMVNVSDSNHHCSNIQIVIRECFQFGHVQNSVIWERVITINHLTETGLNFLVALD